MLTLKRGDILEFRAGKLNTISGILAALLKRFRPDWTAWGWHLCVVFCRLYNDYLIIEAAPSGVRLVLLSEMRTEYKIHRLLPCEPRFYTMLQAVKMLNGAQYDYIAYLWTALYIITGGRLPRIANKRFTCWELVYQIYELIGYPLALDYQYPVIADFEALAMEKELKINAACGINKEINIDT
jgi:hypothetical protein